MESKRFFFCGSIVPVVLNYWMLTNTYTIYQSYIVLRIRDYPDPFLFFSDGIGALKILFDREGSLGSLGILNLENSPWEFSLTPASHLSELIYGQASRERVHILRLETENHRLKRVWNWRDMDGYGSSREGNPLGRGPKFCLIRKTNSSWSNMINEGLGRTAGRWDRSSSRDSCLFCVVLRLSRGLFLHYLEDHPRYRK